MGERFGTDDPGTGSREGGTANEHGDGGRLDAASVSAVLDHPRRRVLVELVAGAEVTTIRDLATEIAAREDGVPPRAVSDERRRSVSIALYHVHVPKLAEHGILAVGSGAERVRPGPNADRVLAVLREMGANTDGGLASAAVDAPR